jgi:ATP dependent DNA ligase domain
MLPSEFLLFDVRRSNVTKIHLFRNESQRANFSRHLLAWSSLVAFARKKSEPMASRRLCPASSSRHWRRRSPRCRPVPLVHEIKFDGYRVQVHLANETVNIFTRRGNDWTHRFKKVSHDAWHIIVVASKQL